MRLPCEPDLWPAFSAALDELLDLSDSDRRRRLADLGAHSPVLAGALGRVLDSAEPKLAASWSFGSGALPAMGKARPAGDADAAGSPGDRVGPWILERELGQGGMGSVWLAVRADGAHTRKVALKLPHAHLTSDASLARFRRERDVLASLSHPAIAGLLDAGVADDGRPWLALEWVEGLPITEACRRDRSPLSRRVALVEAVAGAVASAHARLVVHRDLKPSNLLVTADGRPVLLDFGIAKLLDPVTEGDAPPEAIRAPLTVEGTRVATPDYAAPEQLEGGEITVATDVYALGLLLYELVTGQLPYPRGRRFAGMLAGGELPRASTRIEPEQAPFVGGLSPRALARSLAGDLDAILGRALAPEPAARYSSVEAFASDLGRYRRGEAISARQTPRRERFVKFLRRHRTTAILGGAVVLATALGIGAVLLESLATAREAERANATRDFLIDMLRAADPRIPGERPPAELSARDLLGLGIARLERDRRLDPETRAELTDLFATLHAYLDETSSARSLAHANRMALGERLSPADPRLLDARAFEVWLALQAEDLASAEAMLEGLDRDLTALKLDGSRHRAEWQLAVADLAGARGESSRRRTALENAVAGYARSDPSDRGYAAALVNLAGVRLEDGHASAALVLAEEAELRAAAVGEDTGTELARIAARRGEALLALDRNLEAGEAFRAARRRFAATVGPHHPSSWTATAGLAVAESRLGNTLAAAELRRELAAADGWESEANRHQRAEAERVLSAGFGAGATPSRGRTGG